MDRVKEYLYSIGFDDSDAEMVKKVFPEMDLIDVLIKSHKQLREINTQENERYRKISRLPKLIRRILRI